MEWKIASQRHWILASYTDPLWSILANLVISLNFNFHTHNINHWADMVWNVCEFLKIKKCWMQLKITKGNFSKDKQIPNLKFPWWQQEHDRKTIITISWMRNLTLSKFLCQVGLFEGHESFLTVPEFHGVREPKTSSKSSLPPPFP